MNHKTLVAMLLAGLMVTSGLAMAAAPTTDTSTTDDTSTTSEIVAGSTIVYNETTNSTHSFKSDSKNVSIKVLQNGTALGTYTNSSSVVTHVTSNTTSGTHYFNATFDDDASNFQGIEASPSENVSVEIRRINNTSAASPASSNITVYFENHANKTFTRFDDADTETASPGRYAAIKAQALSLTGDEVNITDPAKAKRTVSVNGDNQSTITVHVADTNASDALAETHDDSTDEGGVTFMGVAKVDDTFVPIMAAGEEAPDWVNTDEDAYVVVDDGGDEVTVQNAGAVLDSDDSSVDIVVVGNEQANFGQINSMMSEYGASNFDAIWTAAMQGEKVGFGDQFDLEA